MKVLLVARNPELASAWKQEFFRYPQVSIIPGSIFDVEADALATPANSFGNMDGGLDGLMRNHFGLEVESRLRQQLADHYFGELPVGLAVVVETGNPRHPYMVSAPTMRFPATVAHTVNAYLAMKAILHAGLRHPGISSIAIPGLCTLSGGMTADRAARQMRIAYERVVLGQYAYSHWREERAFEDFIRGVTPFPPEDLERGL
ncbi:MAG: macro domain-containing protein [Thiobacillus sp.]|nr:macro domain-containing protein [Thiobacillus sp.]